MKPKLDDWRKRELLRPSEVAVLLGESRSGIYSRIARGQIPAVRLGAKSLRIPRVKLEKLLDRLIGGTSKRRPKRRPKRR